MRWVTLLLLIIIFAYSVTLKYMPVNPAFTEQSRFYHVLVRRPAILLVVYMNEKHPDGVLYQNYYDEYRVWMNTRNVGRREWEGSWNDYHEQYPENTALNLYEWLQEMGVTHMMVNPHGEFELPTDDHMFEVLFGKEAYFQSHELYMLMDGTQTVFNTNLADGLGFARPLGDTFIQE